MRNPSQPFEQASVSDLYDLARKLINEAHALRAQGVNGWHMLRVEVEQEIVPCLDRPRRMIVKLAIAQLTITTCPHCSQEMQEEHYHADHKPRCQSRGQIIEQPITRQYKREARPTPTLADRKVRAGALLAQMEEAHDAGDMPIARAANQLLNEMQPLLPAHVWECDVAPRIERLWCPSVDFLVW